MKYFGTDGIRGVANTELTPELAYKTGRAVAYKLKDESDAIVIGSDTRQSRDLLKSALTAGILSVGLDVIDLGIIPTPAVAYFARDLQVGGGIVISASHNPGKFNGIKLFASTGFKFPDEFEEEIEALIDSPIDYYVEGADIGIIKYKEDAHKKYIDFILSRSDLDFKGLKVCLDCGHGATSEIAEELFTLAGAEVVSLNTDFDGMDINDNCGSTNSDVVAKAVIEEKADAGFSFDGDGDRLIAVDEKGRVMDGDHYLAALALYMKEKGTLKSNGIVGTVMANLGLRKVLEENDIDFVASDVGDRYVLEEMIKGEYNLGGEQSGHFLLLDDNTTGCGLLSAVKLLEVVKDSSKTMSQLNDLMVSYPQVLVNAKVTNETKHKYLEDEVIKTAIEEFEEEFHGKGRVLIRPSGTEPLVRVMVEGEDEQVLEDKCRELVEVIENRLG